MQAASLSGEQGLYPDSGCFVSGMKIAIHCQRANGLTQGFKGGCFTCQAGRADVPSDRRE